VDGEYVNPDSDKDVMMTAKSIAKISGLVVLVAAICSVFFVDWGKEPAEDVELIRPLKTLVVEAGQIEKTYQYLGVVEAADEAQLSFDVSGALISLDVKKGERVKEGQLIASLDARDFADALAVAQADADKARITLERLRPAAASGAVSKQKLTDAEAAAASTAAQLSIQQKNLDSTKLTASFDGVIADVLVDNFENVTVKQTIAILQAMDNVDVTVNVPEARVADIDPARIRRGQSESTFSMTLDYFPNKSFNVRPKEFGTQADRLTLSYKVTFTLPRPEGVALLPGMPATVTETRPITADKSKGFWLPAGAVPVDTAGQYFVWTLTELQPDVFEVRRQDVEVGPMVEDNILVIRGAAKGDRIAAAGVHILKEGQKVRLFASDGVGL
jgi:RND family efflux transporter MFP subunit